MNIQENLKLKGYQAELDFTNDPVAYGEQKYRNLILKSLVDSNVRTILVPMHDYTSLKTVEDKWAYLEEIIDKVNRR